MTDADSVASRHTDSSEPDIQISKISPFPPVDPFNWFYQHTTLRRLGPGEIYSSNIWGAHLDGDSDKIVCLALVDELNETQLHRLGVTPEYRRQGIATAMVRRLYEEYGDLKLVCRESLDANDYYEATGWEHVGTQWGDPEDLNEWELNQPPQHPREQE